VRLREGVYGKDKEKGTQIEEDGLLWTDDLVRMSDPIY